MTALDDSTRISALRLDLISANMLVWIASVGRDGQQVAETVANLNSEVRSQN